jgi:hypothetical protein
MVRAYLQLNGYFTVTEYPVVRKMGDSWRTLTDVDIAGFRLPSGELDYAPDPALKVPEGRADMIIGEVKEGRAVINESVTDVEVVAKILRRFGCCSAGEAHHSARLLLDHGTVETPIGHNVRLVAFGTSIEEPASYLRVLMSDVVAYLDHYIEQNWELVRTSGSKDPIFGVMLLLAKARKSATPQRVKKERP